MSLFDVIRYPVIDIFDKAEIDKIPQEIIVPWLKECYSFIGDNGPASLRDAAMLVHMLIVDTVDTISDYETDREEDREEFARMLKAHFTTCLRNRILNFG